MIFVKTLYSIYLVIKNKTLFYFIKKNGVFQKEISEILRSGAADCNELLTCEDWDVLTNIDVNLKSNLFDGSSQTRRLNDWHKIDNSADKVIKKLCSMAAEYFMFRDIKIDQTQYQISYPSINDIEPPGMGWHVDDYRKILKFFVYFTPVDEKNGAMRFAHDTRGFFDSVRAFKWNLSGNLKDTYFSEMEILNKTQREKLDVVSIKCNKPSIFAVDTTSLHTSTRLLEGERRVMVFTFRESRLEIVNINFLKKIKSFYNYYYSHFVVLFFKSYPLSGVKNKIFVSINSIHDYLRAKTFKVKEPDTNKWLQFFSNKNFTLLDIGANIGVYSLYFSKLNPANKVIAIEPDSSSFVSLIRNVNLNKIASISSYPVAIGADDSFSIFHISHFDSGAGAGGLGHKYKFVKNPKTIFLQGIYSLSMNSIFDKLNLFKLHKNIIIKIDTDGNEFDILRSGNVALKNHSIKSILVEVNYKSFSELIDLKETLKKYGFFLVARSNWCDFYEGIKIANFYFCREEFLKDKSFMELIAGEEFLQKDFYII